MTQLTNKMSLKNTNPDTNQITNTLNSNHKKLTNQIDGFSINLHHHQQQLKSIIKSINDLVIVFKRENQTNNKDEINQLSKSLQNKLQIIADCISHIESNQFTSLQNNLLNTINDNQKYISSKIDQHHKSLIITNSNDLKDQSKYIINRIDSKLNVIVNNQSQKDKNYVNIQLLMKEIKNIINKLSTLDIQNTESLHFMQRQQHELLGDIKNKIKDIVKESINNNIQIYNESVKPQSDQQLIVVDQKLSKINDLLCTIQTKTKTNINPNIENQLNTTLNTLFQEIQYIEQIGKENEKNNLIIRNKLIENAQQIDLRLQNIENQLEKLTQSKIEEQHNKINNSKSENKSLNSESLSLNIFLNRINAMEQQFESKLLRITEQQSNFQKCVLQQLNQLNRSNDIHQNNVIDIEKTHTSNINEYKLNKHNNMSLWMSVQQINHNTIELQKEMELLKQQEIAQFESITNSLFRQQQTLSYTTDNISKYIHDSIAESIGMNQNSIKNIQMKVRNHKSILQPSKSMFSSPSIDSINSSNSSNRRIKISRKYNKISKPQITNDTHSDVPVHDDVYNIDTWDKMNIKTKKEYCYLLLQKLFSKELYEHNIQPKNSFYLKFAKRLIENWKQQNKWDDTNWEIMDDKKQLISKIWSFMLLNWNECTKNT